MTTTATRPRYLIRYTPDHDGILNDPRLQEALDHAMREDVFTVHPFLGDGEELLYMVGLHHDVDQVRPMEPDVYGCSDSLVRAVRLMLGEFYGDGDVALQAIADNVVIDAWSDTSEIAHIRPA